MANLDKRRINGPEAVSLPLFRDFSGASKSVGGSSSRDKGKGREYETEERIARGDHGVRPIYLQPSLIPQANGSVFLEVGSLKLACAVYGPRQSQTRGGGGRSTYQAQADVNVEVRYTPFAAVPSASSSSSSSTSSLFPPRVKPGKDLDSETLSSLVHTSLLPCIRLSLLPKSSLDIYISILQADGPLEGIATWATTAASLSLALAGVELWGLCIGVGACLVPVDDDDDDDGDATKTRILVDPTKAEAAAAGQAGKGTIALFGMPALGSISSLEQSGAIELQDLSETVKVLTNAAAQVHLVIAQALQEAAQGATQPMIPGR